MRTKRVSQCQHCSKQIVSSSGQIPRFCCQRCKYITKNKITTIQQICPVCKKTFVYNHNPQRPRPRKYCSSKCYNRLPGRTQEIDSHRHKLKTYGLTIKDFEDLLIKQNHRCAICRRPEIAQFKGKKKRLSVDHCHETNQVRGLLCSRCNFVIGQMTDDWLILHNAIEYLTYWHVKHGSSKVKLIQESPSLN